MNNGAVSSIRHGARGTFTCLFHGPISSNFAKIGSRKRDHNEEGDTGNVMKYYKMFESKEKIANPLNESKGGEERRKTRNLQSRETQPRIYGRLPPRRQVLLITDTPSEPWNIIIDLLGERCASDLSAPPLGPALLALPVQPIERNGEQR